MEGVASSQRFKETLKKITNVPTTTAASATRAALRLYSVKRVGILSPHPSMFEGSARGGARHGSGNRLALKMAQLPVSQHRHRISRARPPSARRDPRHKRAVRERLRALAAAAGARDPELLAQQLQLLIVGAYAIGQSLGPDGPARTVASAGSALIATQL
jgi:hypothetical protein